MTVLGTKPKPKQQQKLLKAEFPKFHWYNVFLKKFHRAEISWEFLF